MTKIPFAIVLHFLLFISCKGQNDQSRVLTQEAIIEQYLGSSAQYGLYSQDRDAELAKGLALDSTIAYLWQQRAMPLFKQGKYELGMEYIDKAVRYDRSNWLEYRAFIKCIFAKTYREAVIDFEACKEMNPKGYVMDHSYDFHIALCYLQLNEFAKAEAIFKHDIEALEQSKGEDWVHHLDLLYYGISMSEQGKYQEAIEVFDRALLKYPEFSDVQYYKAMALNGLGATDEVRPLIEQARVNAEMGYTINEDNVVYERYPYQVRW